MFPLDKNIEYIIYIGYKQQNEIICKLEDKMISNNLGYGTYFGQRQFKADVKFLKSFDASDLKFLEHSEFLDSVCSEENFIDCIFSSEVDILTEQMPIHFKKVESGRKMGREPIKVKKVYFEKKGRRMEGEFKNCYLVDDKYISFY